MVPVREVTGEELLGCQSVVVFGSSLQASLMKRHLERLGLTDAKSMKAREFAIRAHGDQLYGDRPYVEHLEAVVSVLTDFGYGGDYLCAGWLHDVVEDTVTTLDDIERNFGSKVAQLVDAVSGGGDRGGHITSIYRKIAVHPVAAIVKLADRIANIEACESGDKHARRYAREHESFAAVIRPHVLQAMWKRYEEAIRAKGIDGAG